MKDEAKAEATAIVQQPMPASHAQTAYPLQGQQGYPPGQSEWGQQAYPSPGQPGYLPQGQPGYPPQGQPGYPPQGQPGHPQGNPEDLPGNPIPGTAEYSTLKQDADASISQPALPK